METYYVVTCSAATSVIVGFDLRQHTRWGNDSQGGANVYCRRGANRFAVALGVAGYHSGAAKVSTFLECRTGDRCGPATEHTMNLTTEGNLDVTSASSPQVTKLSVTLFSRGRLVPSGVRLYLGITCPPRLTTDHIVRVTLSQWAGSTPGGRPTVPRVTGTSPVSRKGRPPGVTPRPATG